MGDKGVFGDTEAQEEGRLEQNNVSGESRAGFDPCLRSTQSWPRV